MLTVHSANWKQNMMVALFQIDDVQPGGTYLSVTPDRTRGCLVVGSINLPVLKANVIFSHPAKRTTPLVGDLDAQIPVTPSARTGN